MRIPSPYGCDYCPNVKGQTNHWWLRDKRGDVDRQSYGTVIGFFLTPWDSEQADEENPLGLIYEHICSQECAAKALSKWMSAQSANAVKSQVPSEN